MFGHCLQNIFHTVLICVLLGVHWAYGGCSQPHSFVYVKSFVPLFMSYMKNMHKFSLMMRWYITHSHTHIIKLKRWWLVCVKNIIFDMLILNNIHINDTSICKVLMGFVEWKERISMKLLLYWNYDVMISEVFANMLCQILYQICQRECLFLMKYEIC